MSNFSYQAINKQGRQCRGSLEAGSQQDLSVKLKGKGLYLTKVISGEIKTVSSRKTSLAEIIAVTRHLGTLLGAGFPLAEALSFLIKQFKGKPFGKVISKIHQDVKSGSSFHQALSRHPNQFSSLYINMVHAGELSGTLDAILFRLADFFENQQKLRSRLQTIFIYPVIMALVGGGVLFFLLAFVVPIVSEIFIQMNQSQSLPLPTVVLIAVSSFFKKFWWIMLVFLGGMFFSLGLYARKPKGKLFFDKLKLRTPFFCGFFLKASIVNFSRTLATLLAGGMELLRALDIVKDTADNKIVSGAIGFLKKSVSRGASFYSALEGAGIFPLMFIQMVSAGEKSGQLEQLLAKSADIYEDDLTSLINRLVAILEPGIILVMGLAVGFIVLAILLPIFEMSQLIR